MKRLLVLLAALAALAAPAAALAHPLGNFTTNRYSRVEISGDRLYLLYVLDLAEIPTFQAKGRVEALGPEGYARQTSAELARRIRLTVGGERRRLVPLDAVVAFPAGVGGLRTTRLEAVYDAGPVEGDAPVPLAYADLNFPERIGWREVVVRGARGARVLSATVPASSTSDELRAYPEDLLRSPLDVTEARARVVPGGVPGAAPRPGAGDDLAAPVRVASRGEHGFAALVSRQELSAGFVLLSLAVAMFWGAAHALSPGHGKAIVAAYLIGTRGTPRHALYLGLIVTVTHTIGVFALGLTTLALSEFILPEDLYPWLNLVAAMLVLSVGVAVLRRRLGEYRRTRAHVRAPRAQGDHHHHHDHEHAPRRGEGMRGLVRMGISGGIIPCPTALVVLLAAISLHRVAYGLVLILAFSVGLAAAMTAVGLVALGARRALRRVDLDGGVVRLLPAVSALAILGLGIAMTVRSIPSVT